MGVVSEELNYVELNDLIVALTAENSLDLSLRNAFFLTYPSFCTTEEIFRHLVSRYAGLDDPCPDESLVCFVFCVCIFMMSLDVVERQKVESSGGFKVLD